jgi:hypothetical protein
MQSKRARIAWIALVALALASLGLAGGAQAKLTGEFTKFSNCEYKNTEVKKCIVATTESGEVVLGNKAVPIEKPVVLQGGYGKAVEKISKFYGATNGITLSKAPQNVPGGLLGIVPEKESSALVKALIKFFLENSLTGLNSTLELAKPASEIKISELNLAGEEGTALELPVKVHLENPFLGKNCYVGSSSSPLVWKLTTGTTSPPSPNKPITGAGGTGELLEEGAVLSLKNNVMVDNAWSAPKATGCGGILAFLVNPIVNTQLGTITAGHNTAILKNTVNVASAFAMRENDELNP